MINKAMYVKPKRRQRGCWQGVGTGGEGGVACNNLKWNTCRRLSMTIKKPETERQQREMCAMCDDTQCATVCVCVRARVYLCRAIKLTIQWSEFKMVNREMKSNNDAVDKQDAHTRTHTLIHTHTEAIKEKHKAQIAKKTTTTTKERHTKRRKEKGNDKATAASKENNKSIKIKIRRNSLTQKSFYFYGPGCNNYGPPPSSATSSQRVLPNRMENEYEKRITNKYCE